MFKARIALVHCGSEGGPCHEQAHQVVGGEVNPDRRGEYEGRAPEERRAARQEQAVPILNALHAWMIEKASQVDPNSR